MRRRRIPLEAADPVPHGPPPPYVELAWSGELERRAADALRLLGPVCRVCPRACRVDRRADRVGLCGIGRRAIVASAFAHFGEEDCLRGWNGSGTIFFSGCNLRCVFCQNWDISHHVRGEALGPDALGQVMVELQAQGCHNINWVTPEHVVPQILEALPAAVGRGLRLPIVYNTSSYDSLDSLRLLDGIVSIYMPDFKLWSEAACRRYLRRADYAAVARTTIKEMHRQVGPLTVDERGLAVRGLLLRHLVMPGLLEETEAILRWIADELGPGTYVNLMAQYRPAARVDATDEFPEIDRRISRDEWRRAVELALRLGLSLDDRSLAA
ncbi:MAG: radical SAM protein [Chloroflexota bacterium]|nr:MAG: radical SAM protein [Chloroflexota bacterium]